MSNEKVLIVFLSCLLLHGTQSHAPKKNNCLVLPLRVNSSILRLLSHNKTRAIDGTFQHGSLVHYHCTHRTDGVRSKPDGRVRCENGTWIGKRPNCKSSSHPYEVMNVSKNPVLTSSHRRQLKKHTLTCDSLPKIFQGDVRVLSGVPPRKGRFLDGTRLTVSCRIGHLVPRRAILVCENGHWNKTLPQCVVSQCLLPGDVTGGAWSVIGHNPLLPIVQRGWILEAVRIEYDCQPGLFLVGSKLRDCLPSGKWSGEEGFCVAKEKLSQQCQPPGSLPNGRIICNGCSSNKARPYVGTVLTATCNPGYGMLGGEEIVHLRCIFPEGNIDKPRWSRRMPKCIGNDELAAINMGGTGISNGSLWSQDLTVVIAVSTVVMGGLLMIFTAVLACRCVRHAASGRRGRSGSPLHHHHHHPYTVSAASVAAGHRNEDCVALIVPPSYEEAVRDGAPIGPAVSMGTAGPASTLPADGVNTVSMPANNRGGTLHGSRFAHVLSRSPRIRTSGEGRDYRPLVQAQSGSRQSRRAAAAAAAAAASIGNHHHQHVHHHHHGNIPASAGEADSVSRHSTQTSGSHGPAYCLSGSLETMAVSDGTSVTLRTYESQHGGSNPSLISTRPQTGSLCEPQQSCQSPQQQQSNNRGGSDTPGSSGGLTTSDVVVPVRHPAQAPSVPAPTVGSGSGNGNGYGTGYISAGSVVGSEKEDSLSTRS